MCIVARSRRAAILLIGCRGKALTCHSSRRELKKSVAARPRVGGIPMIDPLPGDIFRKGQVLNNTYEIEGVLGRGGTGEVYRARNQITGRVVAVKALNRALLGQRRLPGTDEARGGDARHLQRRGGAIHRLQPHRRWARLPGDGLRGRHAALGMAGTRRGEPARLDDRRAPGGRGAGGDACPPDRPPRPVAGQHRAARRRPGRGGDHRLRHSQGRQRRGADHRRQRLRGQVRIRRARADAREGRAAFGSLRARVHRCSPPSAARCRTSAAARARCWRARRSRWTPAACPSH